MRDRKIDDEHTRKINRYLIRGWMLIVAILFVAYLMEVVKGERDEIYLAVFMAFTVVPALVVGLLYRRQPDRFSLRYEIVVGYMVMYIFVMLTGSTTMVFSYILPMLSLLVLFHQPKIILSTGVVSMFINIISILMRYNKGELNAHNTKDVEIQIALLFLCFLGSYLATRLYDEIHTQNVKFTADLARQNEEIAAQNEEIRVANDEITKRSEEIEQMTMQTITTIANTIDAKDEYTRGHSRRVSEYAVAIAKELGYRDNELTDIRVIGLLHDIGKIGIPDAVLNKPGRLTQEEYKVMKSHTTVGADILKDIDMIKNLDIGAKYHHERIDGKGYPDGLSGEKIPDIAKIIAVADAYDAMSSNRVYRRHLEKDKILRELQNGRGTQWDEKCTDAIIKLMVEDRLPKVNPDADTEVVQQATTILSRVIDLAEDKGGDNKGELDELTSTFGRESGRVEIQNAIQKYGRGCLYIFDIDHFHRINETEGFVVGDYYLTTLVELIRAAQDNVLISRFGADEFVVFSETTTTADAAEAFTKRFFSMLNDRIASDERIRHMSVSVGASEIVTEKDKVMVLYENADKAIYVSKQQGGNAFFCHKLLSDDYSTDEYTEGADLKQLVDMFKESQGHKGAMVAGYPDFTRMYEYISHVAERNNQQVKIMLFTISTVSGVKITIEERDRIMELLKKAIVNSIRSVDISTRYSSTQYVAILIDLPNDYTDMVATRIMTEFYRTYDLREVELHYEAADISSQTVFKKDV